MKRRRLGQHFLKNKNIAEKIAGIALDSTGTILEIGPGKGVLTRILSERSGGRRIVAVEKDPRLSEKLAGEELSGVEIRPADILDFNPAEIADNGTITVIGNIPYYISGEITDWIISGYPVISGGIMMVQKEFFLKITSTPGSKLYSARTVMFGLLFDKGEHFDVKPGSFSPPPKVTSTVFSFRYKDPVMNPEKLPDFYLFLKTAFSQRRKTLVNNLSEVCTRETLIRYLREKNLPENIRPEDLPPEHFPELWGRCLTF